MDRKNSIVALVDDDKIFQFIASKNLQATQLTDQILQFENGEDALTFLTNNAKKAENLPDFIFLDINMPFVDGWRFLQDYATLKNSLTKRISIYMVSSSIDPSDIQRARSNVDVQDYVVKPVSKEKFMELISVA